MFQWPVWEAEARPPCSTSVPLLTLTAPRFSSGVEIVEPLLKLSAPLEAIRRPGLSRLPEQAKLALPLIVQVLLISSSGSEAAPLLVWSSMQTWPPLWVAGALTITSGEPVRRDQVPPPVLVREPLNVNVPGPLTSALSMLEAPETETLGLEISEFEKAMPPFGKDRPATLSVFLTVTTFPLRSSAVSPAFGYPFVAQFVQVPADSHSPLALDWHVSAPASALAASDANATASTAIHLFPIKFPPLEREERRVRTQAHRGSLLGKSLSLEAARQMRLPDRQLWLPPRSGHGR